MRTKIIIASIILLIIAGVIISQTNTKKADTTPQTKTEEIKQTPTSAQSEIKVSTPTTIPSQAQNQVQIQGQNFEIRGAISSISGNSFIISGRTVVIDPSKVVNFQQTTTLEVEKLIKVEGVIINGIMYAREIQPPNQSGKN